MTKKQCRINPEDGKQCKRAYYASLKVKVKHSDTGRVTFQTWDLCKLHYTLFLRDKGEGYYSWYSKKPYKIANVIDYQQIGVI